MHRSITFVRTKDTSAAARHIKYRVFCSSLATPSTSSRNDGYADARPFAEMPGPRGPLGLGSIFNYTPWFGMLSFREFLFAPYFKSLAFHRSGPYSWERLHSAGLAKYTAFGPCVRETMVPGVHVVWLFDPVDIARVFADGDAPRCGHYPQRTSHLALQKYRSDRPHVYRTGGLLPTNGTEWWRIRQELQRGLSSPQHVRQLLSETERITREFISDVVPADREVDVMPELARLNLER